jgi:hypothetical protein
MSRYYENVQKLNTFITIERFCCLPFMGFEADPTDGDPEYPSLFEKTLRITLKSI